MSNPVDIPAALAYLLAEPDHSRRVRWYQHNDFDITLIEAYKQHVELHREKDQEVASIAGERAYEACQHLDDRAQALGHWTYALALASTGDFEAALEHFEAAQALYYHVDQAIEAAKVGVRQMQVLASLGEHQQALALAQRCHGIFLAHHFHHGLAQVEVNTGIILSILGQAERSREALLRALPLMQECHDEIGIASIYVNLGYSYQDQDQFAQAESYFQQALTLFEQLQQPRSIAGTKLNIALLYRRQGKLAQALAMLFESQRHYQQHANDPDADLARLEQARVSLELNLLTEAELLARELIDSFSQRSQLVEANEAREVLAQSITRMGRVQQGFVLWQEIQDNWLTIGNAANAALARLVLLRLRLHTAPYGSLMLQEVQALILDLEQHDMPVAQTYSLCMLAQLYLAQNDITEAQLILEQAQTLSQGLQTATLTAHVSWHLGKLAAAQEDIVTAERCYLRALDDYQQEQDRLTEDLLRASYLDDKVELYDDYLSLLMAQKKYEQAFLFIDQSKSRLLLGLLDNVIASPQGLQDIASIRSQLSKQQCFVTYHVVHHQLYAFTLSGTDFACHHLAPLHDIEENLAQFHFFSQRLRQGGMYHHIYSYESLQERLEHYLHQLYRTLLAPLALAADIEQMIIVPHAALHHLPFNALFDGQRHMIDRLTISLVPSAAIYLQSITAQGDMRHEPQALNVAAFGPALHENLAIEQELRMISKRVPSATIFSNQEASKEMFFEQSQTAQVIHIATHGAFRHDNPMFSGFHLADGWLSLQEIYQQRIKAKLVVLASCESALSQEFGIDQQFGLTRAFLAAGASSILATLWPIEGHASVHLIDQFYHHLSHGYNLASALRQAQLSLRQDFPEPYVWAAFSLVGDPACYFTKSA